MSSARARQGGFSLTEAIAALLVLSLALTQLPALIALFGGLVGQATQSVDDATDQIAQSVRAREEVAAGESPGSAEPVAPTAPDNVHFHRPCQFDVVGRRCL